MTSPKAAWDDQTLADPHHVADKARRVRDMFGAIAPCYDLNNRLHSLGQDQAWRRAAVRDADLQPRDVVLDVACGTGDLTLAFARRLWRLGRGDGSGPEPGQVIGLDFTYEMLPLAHAKARRERAPDRSTAAAALADTVVYGQGDAMRLPLADQSVDVVSIAFGIRNVADPLAAARQFHRVLRPGGRVIILEFSLPRNPLLRGLYNLYFRHVMPRTATLIARDRSGAYRYLPQSVNTFIDRPQMVQILEQAGFGEVSLRPLTCGIAVIYRAVKAADPGGDPQISPMHTD